MTMGVRRQATSGFQRLLSGLASRRAWSGSTSIWTGFAGGIELDEPVAIRAGLDVGAWDVVGASIGPDGDPDLAVLAAAEQDGGLGQLPALGQFDGDSVGWRDRTSGAAGFDADSLDRPVALVVFEEPAVELGGPVGGRVVGGEFLLELVVAAGS